MRGVHALLGARGCHTAAEAAHDRACVPLSERSCMTNQVLTSQPSPSQKSLDAGCGKSSLLSTTSQPRATLRLCAWSGAEGCCCTCWSSWTLHHSEMLFTARPYRHSEDGARKTAHATDSAQPFLIHDLQRHLVPGIYTASDDDACAALATARIVHCDGLCLFGVLCLQHACPEKMMPSQTEPCLCIQQGTGPLWAMARSVTYTK